MTLPYDLPKDEHPWSEWPTRMCRCLWEGGHRDPGLFSVTPDNEFRNTQGISHASIKKIRELYPNQLVESGPPQVVPGYKGRGGLATKGYKGNAGRSVTPAAPADIRTMAREYFAARTITLNEIAEGKMTFRLAAKCEECGHEPAEAPTFEELVAQVKRGPSAMEQIKAIDTLGKYGLGAAKGVDKRTLTNLFKDILGVTARHLQNVYGSEEGGEVAEVLWAKWQGIVKRYASSLQGLE